jgi:hypothetical protein
MGLNNLTTGAGTSEFTDIESDNITNSATITSESVNPKFLTDDYTYTAGFPGGDADTRLQNALSQLSRGDVLYLEDAKYTSDITITTGEVDVRVPRTAKFDSGCDIRLEGRRTVFSGGEVLNFNNATLTIDAEDCTVRDTIFADITVTSNVSRCIIISNHRANITDNGVNSVIIANT